MTSIPSRASILAATVSNAVGRIGGYQFTSRGYVNLHIRLLMQNAARGLGEGTLRTPNREWIEHRTFDLLVLKIVAFLTSLTYPAGLRFSGPVLLGFLRQ